MNTSYRKERYSRCPGFQLTYTAGPGAGGSTLDYPHTTVVPILIYFLQGKGNLLVEGTRYELHDGDAVLLTPGELFHCQISNDAYHERIVLHFRKEDYKTLPCDTTSLFDAFEKRAYGTCNLIPASIMEATGLSSRLTELLSSIRQDTPQDHLRAFCSAAQILSCLSDAQSRGSAAPSKETPLVEEIRSYLTQHATEQISMDTVAQHFGLSKSYLSHLFRQQVGMSVWNYVILRRLHQFNELLRKGHTIEAACYGVGFQNYSNFYRLYKKHTGIMPTQYKQQLEK